MSYSIAQYLLKKTGNADILTQLGVLSLSELNSVLMEVFSTKAHQRPVKELLQAYQHNRFVTPSEIDPVEFMKTELQLLQLAKDNAFRVCSAFLLMSFIMVRNSILVMADLLTGLTN